MRLSSFAAGVAMVLAVATPRSASASPLLHDFNVAADGSLTTFAGDFEWDNDVALVHFVLGDGVFDLFANTTSYAAGGFDPLLSLYYAPTTADPMTHYTYFVDGGEYPAIFDDTETGFDSAFALTLNRAGLYTLALTQTGNFHQEGLLFDWNADEFRCAPAGDACVPQFGGGLGSFALNVQLTPAEDTSVPEPGTLSLMALGSAAAIRLRRRRAREGSSTFSTRLDSFTER